MNIDPLLTFMYAPLQTLRSVPANGRTTHNLLPGDRLDIGPGACRVWVNPMPGAAQLSQQDVTATLVTIGPYNTQVQVTIQSNGPEIPLVIARLNR